MQEKDLTEKQRRWLEASRKIGPGPMTKSERKLLEQLYADMDPREQQELYDYIQMKYGDTETKNPRSTDDQFLDDPISRMQLKMWHAPSGAFKRALSSIRRSTPPGR